MLPDSYHNWVMYFRTYSRRGWKPFGGATLSAYVSDVSRLESV